MELNKDDIENVLMPLTKEHLKQLSRKDLVDLFLAEQSLRIQGFKELEKKYEVEGRYIVLKRRFYAASTEKTTRSKNPSKKSSKKIPSKKTLRPSERYPNAEIVDIDVTFEHEVECECCGHNMQDTGLRDVSEMLTVIPKKYIIERHHHPNLKCPCCNHMETTPRAPRIKPGSSYSDQMIIDVSMSKFCDLIPMERYAAMAAREGFKDIPSNSLIELTHYLAYFLRPVVDMIKSEVVQSNILRADETPHRMMEQEQKKQWYLWGFSTLTSAYYECHSSRSGDIAAELLKDSKCSYLMTDVYAGYGKAVRLVNKKRADIGQEKIIEIFCNAHARRNFKNEEDDTNTTFFLWCYKKIYFQEKESPNRMWQDRYFRAMKRRAEKIKQEYSTKSGIFRAVNYFLKNYDGLTLFLQISGLPIDNNHQERLMRSYVVGRKTWYGTHSILGAQTAAALFTIVESCKINKINPRLYIEWITDRIHTKGSILTPFAAKEDFPQIFSQGSPPQKTD